MKNQMQQIMQQAQQMQKKMMEIQAELDGMEIEGSAGGGMVRMTLTGKSDMKKVTLDPSLCKPDEREMLEDLIIAAYNDARKKVEDAAGRKMAALSGGMGMPPGFQMPF